jgi:hypothetical protein
MRPVAQAPEGLRLVSCAIVTPHHALSEHSGECCNDHGVNLQHPLFLIRVRACGWIATDTKITTGSTSRY